MKKDILKNKNRKELEKELEKKRKQLRVLRFNLAVKSLKNPQEIKETKKDIARILTIINQKK